MIIEIVENKVVPATKTNTKVKFLANGYQLALYNKQNGYHFVER